MAVPAAAAAAGARAAAPVAPLPPSVPSSSARPAAPAAPRAAGAAAQPARGGQRARARGAPDPGRAWRAGGALLCGAASTRSSARPRRRLAHARRRAVADVAGGAPASGLAAWRASQQGSGDGRAKLPVILFPDSDLLLLGHTKRMHLFEQRWVDMVETARSQFNGIVGLVYFGRDGNVVRVTTIAEIVACDNLGAVGRMVVVRGVSRGSLLGLSKEVPMSDSFGYAVVEELAELCADDVAPPAGGAVGGAADGGGGAAAAAAASLTALMKELDLSEPRNASSEVKAKAEVSKGDDQTGESSDAEEPRQRAPQLWTHERVSPAEEFAALSGEDSWAQRRAAVEDCLSGVPICGAAAALDGAESATIAAAEAAVIDLYTALAAASLNLRLQLFADDGAGVGERLLALSAQLREKQGLARARRALAGVFADNTEGE